MIPVARLLARVRHVPSRAEEMRAIARGLRAESRAPAGDDERALALRMRALKEQLAAATGEVASCRTCATGLPRPGGAFDGGFCCGGRTLDIFVENEVAALAQSGTRPRALTAPRTEHAGCAFRGETGCTLAPGDRTTLCLRFVCNDLRRELHRLGRLDEIEALVAEIEAAYARFGELRAARLDRAWADALAADLAASR